MKNCFLGFVSVGDFIKTLFGDLENIIKIITALTLGIITFLTNYVYEDENVIITLWILYALDFLFAFILAFRLGNIVSRRIPRIILNVTAATLLISVTWWMGKEFEGFKPLSGMVIAVFFVTQFISIVENLTELEILPEEFNRAVKKRFNIGRITKQRKIQKKEKKKS